MSGIQHAEVVGNKIWLLIGENTGLHQATKRYLESRGQIVVYNADMNKLFEELRGILNAYKSIDMLIVNDVKKDSHLQSLVEKVYTISSFMRKDGTGRIIFMLSNDFCFKQLQNTEAYQHLKRAMKDVAIQVQCFE